jgi:hypothetical protein
MPCEKDFNHGVVGQRKEYSMTPIQKRDVSRTIFGLFALGIVGLPWTVRAVEEKTASEDVSCCKAGDETPPNELVKKVPKGQLHSPYQDYAKLAKEEDLVKQFRLPGCNECHGGTGGGGICPALTQGIWFWGNTDDVLFRLVTLGSADLEKEGYTRLHYGSTNAGHGNDHQDLGPALEDHRLHSFDQSSRCKSS